MIDILSERVFLATMGSVFALLIIASVMVALLGKVKPHIDIEELVQRVRSWWIMVVLFFTAIILGNISSLLFFSFVSFVALKEYLSLIPTRRADRRVLFWAYLAVPLQYWWIFIGWYGMFIIFIPVYAFLFLPMRMVLLGETRKFLYAAGTLHWGLMTTVFSLSHLAYLLVLPASADIDASGPYLVLYLLCLTQLNDVFQWCWGKSFGTYKVIPQVSPNKSWQGLIGGVLTTIVLAVLLGPFLTPLTHFHALLAGVIIGLGGFVGDITISAVKRDIGVDDAGNILPGHGGILDRVDSLTYTAPLFLHFIRYLYF